MSTLITLYVALQLIGFGVRCIRRARQVPEPPPHHKPEPAPARWTPARLEFVPAEDPTGQLLATLEREGAEARAREWRTT